MSLHTLVYSIDSSVLSTNTIEKFNEFENLVIAYPNPTINNIKLKFLVKDQYLISLFYPNGIKIYETLVSNKKIYDLKTSVLME